MEPIIMMVVVYVISAIFKSMSDKKKPDKPTKAMPPFSQQNVPQPTESTQQREEKPAARSLEDFAKGIFEQLESKQQPEQKPQVIEQMDVEPKKFEVRQERVQTTRPERGQMAAAERPLVEKAKQEEALQFVPNSKQALMQAVVMSEILAPPKSRRK